MDTDRAQLLLMGGVTIGVGLLLLARSPERLRRDSESGVNLVPWLSPERRKREIEMQYRLNRVVPFVFLVMGLVVIVLTLVKG